MNGSESKETSQPRFAPEIFDQEHVKVLVYGAGPKIAWREKKWEPWAHAIFGGSHEQPQTAGNSKNAFAVQVGGGADYRFNPRLSGRLEADWVHTSYFGQSQNNFELMGGRRFPLLTELQRRRLINSVI